MARTSRSPRRRAGSPLCRWRHSLETYGYRLDEPDGRRMLPGRLAGQAATVARQCRVRTLVLTHFSRYADPGRFLAEARPHFDGDVVVAEDLMRVPVPPRLRSGDDRAAASRD